MAPAPEARGFYGFKRYTHSAERCRSSGLFSSARWQMSVFPHSLQLNPWGDARWMLHPLCCHEKCEGRSSHRSRRPFHRPRGCGVASDR